MQVNAVLEERVSKNGNPYYCVVIKITDKVDKTVLLDRAEAELIRLTYTNKVKLSSSSASSSN